MCGIAGFWAAGPMSRGAMGERLARMTAALAHRGPDDEGAHLDTERGLGLGHRRLAVVDLTDEGHQPMTSPSGRYVMAYNGEVYNVEELGRALRQTPEGAPPMRGHSDTELLLAAVDRWGLEGALERAVGMFALAVWDTQSAALHLARDRLGKKPLAYSFTPTGLVFGSELHALRAWPELDRTLDRQALDAFLRLGHVPAPHGIYASVRKVLPGTVLTVTAPKATSCRVARYWDPVERCLRARANPFPGDEDEVADAVESVLRRAVEQRMVADVPVGAFLSGGIDSSLVVALMQAQSSRPVRTFSVGYADAAYDESGHAERVARHLGTQHQTLRVTAEDALDLIPSLGHVYDEPFADSSQIPTLLVSRFARREVTVALSGDGGDELFGGYNRHLWGPHVLSAIESVPLGARRRVAEAMRRVPPERWEALLSLGGRVTPPVRLPGQKAHKLARLLEASSSRDLYQRLRSHVVHREPTVIGARAPLGLRLGAPASLTVRERFMLDDLCTYLPDDILTKVDRASMAVALEVRAPLLDHRLVELSFRLPMRHKAHHGRTKRVLRRVLHRYVPPALVERPKMGFGVPVGDWLRGPLRGWAEDLLGRDRLRADGYLADGPMRASFEDHLAGRRDATEELWCALMFQSWLVEERRTASATAQPSLSARCGRDAR